MKRLRNVLIGATFLFVAVPQMAYAQEPLWKDEVYIGVDHESVILENGELSSEDVLDNTTRGIRLSTAMLSIENEQDGTLLITVNTFTHKDVDRIYEVVFLDEWDEKNRRCHRF